ncbi:MAG: YicC/YloC family endoribonuclease [Alistipes sp.]
MIKSMTGFGKGEALLPQKKITVEIRTLNSKQMDLNIKLPSIYRQSEYEIRNLLTKALQRGKADVFINVESHIEETAARINKEVFHIYYKQIQEICTENGMAGEIDSALIQSILRMPDVVSMQEQSISEEESAALMGAVADAIEHLDAFRTQEGAILIADLLKRVEKIETYKQEVVPFEKARTETVKSRLRDNLVQFQVGIDTNRLEQEMIYYLEKLDITEEKVRLSNHCAYFREVAAAEEAPGRKLGFITQEMGREINTLGSKANESNIQILVVKMKDELEKIKEQVLNIL